MDYTEEPDNPEEQIRDLGGQSYSLGKHYYTRKIVKEIILKSLDREDLHYILASSMGVLDETNYSLKNMRSIMLQNKFNKDYRHNHPDNYEKRVQNFINTFPFEKQKRIKEFKENWG